MKLILKQKENKTITIKLAEVIRKEQALVLLHYLDYEYLDTASLCEDNGLIIYEIKNYT